MTDESVLNRTSKTRHSDDNMSHWHRSVNELVVWHRQQRECERAQEALSRVTSCFQQLVTSLGSSADSNFLREEMDETRRVAHQLCTGLSERLVHLLSECDSASSSLEDRQKLERLWVLFLSALESFLSDLQTAYSLIGRFPLTQPKDRRSLLNTGCTDGMVGVVARVASAKVPWHTVEDSSSSDVTHHITVLEAMLAEMQLKVRKNQGSSILGPRFNLSFSPQVPVPFWSVEATQPAWAEAAGEHEDPEDTLEDLMEVEVVSNKTACFQSPCCGLSCVG
ncbi:regulator of G-protein signaling 9-binding protein-like isoform X1 [Takifugu flavidus]|uniref:regulator of G-protein signaling 9-binding protein-like isoform X1 n=2 Tax=Takifugu flavidus TaxID=433684 RepID=UPI00254466A6|nr:regulator of G-protein signaling 9-binding protein-like isoform X1 [Takifugu flavidus]